MAKEEIDYYLNLDIDKQEDVDILKDIAKLWKRAFEIVYEDTSVNNSTQVFEQLKSDFPNGLNNK